jgi:hypothetical protein
MKLEKLSFPIRLGIIVVAVGIALAGFLGFLVLINQPSQPVPFDPALYYSQ